MARRALRAASVALAGGAISGFILGGVYMSYAIDSWSRNPMVGLVAAWAVTVWSMSAAVAALAYWTWRTDFGKAATVLAFAGLAALYLAVQYLGHDFSPWPSILLGTVAALILVPTAAAYILSRRERRSSSASRDIPAR